MWQERLREMRKEDWLNEIDPLNYGLKAITVGSLSNLVYCEQQTKLNIINPDAGDDDKLIIKGRNSEETISSMISADIESIIQDIEDGKYKIVKMGLFSKFNERIIVGTPDTIIFYQGKPLFLIEYKKSKNIHEIYDGERIQIQLYHWLVEKMGFDIANLMIILVKSHSYYNYESIARENLGLLFNNAKIIL